MWEGSKSSLNCKLHLSTAMPCFYFNLHQFSKEFFQTCLSKLYLREDCLKIKELQPFSLLTARQNLIVIIGVHYNQDWYNQIWLYFNMSRPRMIKNFSFRKICWLFFQIKPFKLFNHDIYFNFLLFHKWHKLLSLNFGFLEMLLSFDEMSVQNWLSRSWPHLKMEVINLKLPVAITRSRD